VHVAAAEEIVRIRIHGAGDVELGRRRLREGKGGAMAQAET
jgi:hypothetical protein